MFELDQDHDISLLTPIYIGLAPRDPREHPPVSDEAIEFIEPVSIDELADCLLDLGIPGQVIDGAQVGAPGWVMARGLGWSDGYFIRSATNENSGRSPFLTISSDDLAAYLAEELNVSCRIGPSLYQEPQTESIADLSVHKRAGAVIGQYRSTDAAMLAHGSGEPLWFTYGPKYSIVSGARTEADLSAVVQYPSRGPVVGLERNGPWRRIMVVDAGMLVAIHEWGPDWLSVDPRSPEQADDSWLTSIPLSPHALDPADLVLEYFIPPQASADEFADSFDLTPRQLEQLELVLADRNAIDPLTDVLRLLGLPDQAAEIAEGWREGHDLPGATRVEPQTFGRALWSSVTTVPQEPGVSAWLQRVWLTRPQAYYWITAGEVALYTVGAAYGRKKNKRGLVALCAALGVLTVADVLIPARLRGGKQ